MKRLKMTFVKQIESVIRELQFSEEKKQGTFVLCDGGETNFEENHYKYKHFYPKILGI